MNEGWFPSSDTLSYWANLATAIALACNVIAIFYAAWQLKIARRAASASSIIPLVDSFRQAWSAFVVADEDAKNHAFADIANLIELTCTILEDGLLVGRSRDLMREYLITQLRLMNEVDDYRVRFEGLVESDRTFAHTLLFLKTHRNRLNHL